MIAENIANIRLLVFISGIAFPKYNPFCFTLYMVIKYLVILKQQQIFRLQAVSPNFLKSLLNDGEVQDLNNTIVVGGNILQSGVKFVVVDAGSKRKIRRKVFIVSKDSPENFTLLTYTLFYNLQETADCTFNDCREKNFSFADEVELSLISCSTDWSQFVVDNILKNYFETPKLLYKGDVIAIDLKGYGKDLFHISNKLIHIDTTMYFKCNKIIFNEKSVSGGYLCAVDKSTLKQTTNVQSFIPKNIYDSEGWTTSLYPEALENYIEDMKRAVHPFIAKKDFDFHPIFLLEGRKGSGKSLLVNCIASHFGMHLFTINNFDVSANVYAQNETKLRNVFFGGRMAAPSVLEIRNFENFGKNNEGQYDERLINHFINELVNYFHYNKLPVILFCCSNEKNIPVELKRVFLKIFELKAPSEEEREKILRWILKNNNYQTAINLNSISNKTHGFLYEDLRVLVDHAVTDFHRNTKHFGCNNNIPEEYFLKALDFMQSNYNESLGAPKVPKVTWSDVGGLNDVKEEIIKTIKLPLRYPQLLKSSGLKRSGILLFGPPGTGKTLIAKAVATECGLCFLSVKGPELLNMYVGQSEQNVREVFERAREASPCIIFFDELDSLAPNRGASGDSGGVMDRVVSQLLAEMDGLNRTGTIFIIGATNRPDLIDPALLRPGRFDKLLYVGPCTDRTSKFAVLQALTRNFKFSEDLVLDSIVDLCPEGFSGADFYGICSSAWMSAVRRLIMKNEITQKTNASLENVVVTLDDFKFAIETIKPSISQEDLEYFHRLKADFK